MSDREAIAEKLAPAACPQCGSKQFTIESTERSPVTSAVISDAYMIRAVVVCSNGHRENFGIVVNRSCPPVDGKWGVK